MPAKQVIVMKKFPKGQRIGKYCSQASHASVGALLSIGNEDGKNFVIPMDNQYVAEWITSGFKKITCYVETDEELGKIYQEARKAGLPCCLIKDSGLTEYNGVPTLTAVGIGPDNESTIDKITGHLPLF